MKNLLVPIGSSGNGPNTLQYAIDLAQKLNAKVYVAQVYESTRVSGSLKNLDAVLEEDSTNELLNILTQIDFHNKGTTSTTSLQRVARTTALYNNNNNNNTNSDYDYDDDFNFKGGIVGVLTIPKNFELRQKMRSTWMKDERVFEIYSQDIQ